MGYVVGVDLGTTFTAAAVWRDGSAQIASLGSRGAAIPSVVLLRDDQTELTGEAADRRAMTEPERVAREFKRRLGDTTPVLVGGSPFSAEALMSRLLRAVVNEVATREGGPPEAVAISHPANWGAYKIDLLRQAIRLADLPDSTTLLTEPEAAAISYATQQRLDPGQVVAVYDLGGGTFDAAVLRRTETGFEILGQPEGIERLGGIDFDAAVFAHVSRVIGEQLAQLDEDDPAAQNAVARLRADCVLAKEALSSDTDASIPVLLPNVQTEIRITRSEFEALIRPSLVDSIQALHRALRSAEISPEQVDAVLLVGGSSRIPLVAQLVGAELGRPVAVDAHPKHAIALGTAHAAALATGAETLAGAAAAGPPTAAPSAPVEPVVPPAAAVPPSAPVEPVVPPAAAVPPSAPVEPVVPPAAAAPPSAPVEPVVPPAAAAAAAAASSSSGYDLPDAPGRAPVEGADPGPPPTTVSQSRKPLLIGIGAAVAAIVIALVAISLFAGGDDTPTETADEPSQEPADEPAASSTTTTSSTTSTTTTTTTTTLPPTVCELNPLSKCAEITDIELTGDGAGYLITWETFNYTPVEDLSGDHGHFYWDTFDAAQVSSDAEANGLVRGQWDAISDQPFDSTGRVTSPLNRPDDATEVCVTPANGSHQVIDPEIFDCVEVPA